MSSMPGMVARTRAQKAAAAAAIRKMGAQNVVISLGKAGALLQTAEETWLTHSPSVKEKNPIGAGDSMVGGLAWALTRGFSLKDSLGWGVACGAATASMSGTEASEPAIV